MPGAIGNAQGVDLNSASPEELDRIGGLGHDRVQRIIQNRPFNSWDDLRQVDGFGGTLADDLRQAGASLGGSR